MRTADQAGGVIPHRGPLDYCTRRMPVPPRGRASCRQSAVYSDRTGGDG